MSRPPAPPTTPPSIRLEEGWHCTHIYYNFDRTVLQNLGSDERCAAAEQMISVLENQDSDGPARLQTSVVSGHKADIGLMILDPDPLTVENVHQRLMGSRMGPVLLPTYSFVSITEVSEYVPSLEQYGQRLVDEGEQLDSPAYQAKMQAYERREPMMRKQRLTPDLPEWPAMCFYPMNKKRKVGENWFTLPFDERNKMMAEHARSGMSFAGKVSQLITVSVGFDDWEWGVTLWGANPKYLSEIVYAMRFDEASARFAEFGPFYTSYVETPTNALKHCMVI